MQGSFSSALCINLINTAGHVMKIAVFHDNQGCFSLHVRRDVVSFHMFEFETCTCKLAGGLAKPRGRS